MRADGEPISVGGRDQRAAERQAWRNALLVATFFGAVVLINGILAILLITWWQAMGWWESAAGLEITEGLALDLAALRTGPQRGV